MSHVLEILSLSVLSLIINSIHCAGSIHTVTCQEHGEAVLTFHFPFVSGPEDLHVTFLKIESIDGDTELTVIYALHNDAVEHHAAEYRDRTEIRTDLSIGKLDLILKDVEKSDEGLYKCQAANKKNYDEKMVQLYIEYLAPEEMLMVEVEEEEEPQEAASTAPEEMLMVEVEEEEEPQEAASTVKATEILAAEGESVTFQPDFSGPRTEVIWKIGEDKLVEMNQNEAHYYRLADRASSFFHSGSLTIRELVESDSGYYSGNILAEGKYHETRFILKVSPSKPEVHYSVTNGIITVYCETTSMGVMYEWRDSSGDLLSTEAVYTASPETLRISHPVTCIVRNKVSESSSSVTIEDYTPKENTESNGKREIPISASLLSVVILVSLAVILILFLGCKRRFLRLIRKFQEYPEESHLSLYCDNPLDSLVKSEKP